MSHIVSIETQIRDVAALNAACTRLGLAEPVQETVQLFTNQATGFSVRLPGWRYPVVCDLVNGSLKYDNFSGRWGEQIRLDNLLQAYAVEKAKLEARRQGHSMIEQSLANGSIKLTIQVGGTNAND